ncbi:MAG TPA: amidohydrolase family protein, partial [Rhodanobacteraceae bacterium]|nr:amidohydrolase family protein [Rhodanobacteraceae bacterium]
MRFHALGLAALAVSAATLAAAATISGFPPKLQPADLVLRGGTIATLDPLQPQVQAIAIRDGRIEGIGSDAEIARYIGPKTQTLDLHGAFVTPGFMEGHGHLMDTGYSLMQLELGKAPNWDAIVAMVKAAVAKAKPGQWIVGSGWHEGKWKPVPQPNVEGLPLPASLDAVSPNNPVLLNHTSGHGVYVNAVAL